MNPEPTDTEREPPSVAAVAPSPMEFQGHLLDMIEEGVVGATPDGTILYWNKAAAGLYGWQAEEVTGKNLLDLSPSFWGKANAKKIMASLAKGEEWKGEGEVSRKDGSRFVAKVTSRPVFNDQGHLIAMVGIIKDHTAASRRESEGRKCERKLAIYNKLLENIGDAVFFMDENNRVTFWNQAAERLYGWPAHKAIGKDVVELLAGPAGRQQAFEFIARTRKEHRWSGDFCYVRKDGSRFIGSSIHTLLPATKDMEEVYISVNCDRTDELEAVEQAKKIRRERAFHGKILDSIGDAVVAVDRSQKVIYWNQAAERLYGWGREEVLGTEVSALFEYEGAGSAGMEDIRTGLLAGRSTQGHYRTKRRDGQWIHVHVISTPIQGDDGDPETVVNIVRDRSKELQTLKLEAEAIRQKAHLESLTQREADRTRFVHMIAHELNNPLTPIVTQLAIVRLKWGGALPEGLDRSLKIIDRGVARTRRIVKDLLDVARIQGHRLEVNPQKIRLDELLMQAVQELGELANAKKIGIHADVEEPSFAGGDAERISQVATNLLRNAINHTPAGSRITLRCWYIGDEIQVEVADNGPGIALEDQKRIFEPFEQAGEGEGKGSGLGLYICRGIMEAHHGSIWCESDGQQSGSRFIFRMPAAIQDPEASMKTAAT